MTYLSSVYRGLEFKNPKLLEQALTHKSFLNEATDRTNGHNERLEFLGDAVLDLALSDFLMLQFPDFKEGDLSKLRAGLVNETTLCQVAMELGLQEVLRLGKGEQMSGGHLKPRLLASVFEAIVGAIYLDAGYEPAKKFVFEVFYHRVRAIDPTQQFDTDYKTRLQERMQEAHRKAPQYKVIRQEGPDHSKTFFVEVSMDGRVLAQGMGKTKKQAEQNAAQLALRETV